MNELFALQETFNEQMGWNRGQDVERRGLLTDTVVQDFAATHQSECCREVLQVATRIEGHVQAYWEAELQEEEMGRYRCVFQEAASSEDEDDDLMAEEILGELDDLASEEGSLSRGELTPDGDDNGQRTPSDIPRAL